MDDEKVTTIISADYMYIVFIADNNVIDDMLKILNSQDIDKDIKNETNKYKQNKINKNKKRNIYIKLDVDTPCINMLEDDAIQNILTEDAKLSAAKYTDKSINKGIPDADIDRHKKYITVDEGVETAQCLTWADISYPANSQSEKSKKMLMVLISEDTHFKLSYPVLQLDEEENPAELIDRWLTEHDLKDVITELILSPVNIVGTIHDILVFSAVINSSN